MIRTSRFAVLGMSLSNVFDITNANDLMKGLLNILAEYEQSKDENYKPKMVRISTLQQDMLLTGIAEVLSVV